MGVINNNMNRLQIIGARQLTCYSLFNAGRAAGSVAPLI